MTLLALAAAAVVTGAAANISLVFLVADQVSEPKNASAEPTSVATAA